MMEKDIRENIPLQPIRAEKGKAEKKYHTRIQVVPNLREKWIVNFLVSINFEGAKAPAEVIRNILSRFYYNLDLLNYGAYDDLDKKFVEYIINESSEQLIDKDEDE